MTRLRLAEQADVRGDGRSETGGHGIGADLESLTRRWRDSIEPDFIVHRQGVTPCETSGIRTYRLPVIDLVPPGREGLVHPNSDGVAAEREPSTASIIMLTRDDRTTLRRNLPALLRHTDPRHELVFVDADSRDGTVDELQEVALGRANTQLILLTEDIGRAAGLNHGLAAATGDHLVLLRPDIVVTPAWLENLIAAAERQPRTGLCAPLSNLSAGGQASTDAGYDTRTLGGLDSHAADLAAGNAGRTEPTLYVSATCLLIKREVAARIGGLDAAFTLGRFEGVDYGLRARLAGYDARIVQDSYVHQTGVSALEMDLETLDRIQQMWQVFKRKWDLPVSQGLNAPLDLNRLLERSFEVARHFQDLPGHERLTAPAVPSDPALAERTAR
jgi:GT2 family glycosyltransferase